MKHRDKFIFVSEDDSSKRKDYFLYRTLQDSRDLSVGIAMGHGIDDRGSIPSRGKRLLSSP
jgi:hypothetical protein